MNTNPESRALLTKTQYRDPEDHSSCEEWSDDSSCSSYSNTDSSIAEWEGLVDENGELLYIDCHPHVSQTVKEIVTEPSSKIEETFARTPTRRSTKGKFVRLIRRRESKRYSKRSFMSYTDAYATSEATSSNKVTFRDCQEGEVRDVTLQVDPKSRQKLGRRASLIESLLGITISTFADGDRIMVAGFIPDGEAIKHRNIKIGDWLKCVNDTEVTFQTVNGFLETITEPQQVHIKLQRIAGIEVTSQPPKNELSNQSEFVRQLTSSNSSEDDILRDLLCDFSVGIIYLTIEGLSETGPEFDGVLYCYPTPMNRNTLCTSRGSFITLNHLLPDVLHSTPSISTVLVNNVLTHIIYSNHNNKLLLLSFPDARCSAKESLKMSTEIIGMLEFCYQTIDRCFTTNTFKPQVDRFFSRFFARLLTSGTWPGAPQHVELQELDVQKMRNAPVQFETILPAAHWIPLPREAQMQLDDALNEFEASDYRDWNEDPLDCQRLFTVVGSCFYHDGYMLASHLPWDDLVDIHCFCRQQGLLHLSSTEPIRTFVLWREVYSRSCNRGFPDNSTTYQLPDGKWYLLIVGNAKNLFMVLMETGGCTVPPEENQGPDVFYVEEAQDTLRHIQNMGIPNLAEKWISLNVRPQIATIDLSDIKNQKRIDFFGTIKLKKNQSPTPPKPPSPASKKPEVTSILKHRSPVQRSNISGSGSLFSNEDISEDSASQGAHSEISDEPVVGRRATREKNILESDDSDSDWENYRPESQISSNCEITDLKHLSEMIPTKLTAGPENVLYHYMQFDSTEGILLCPPSKRTNQLMEQILANFKRSCQSIHSLLQNTIRFKNMLAQDMAKNVVNKSLIAIKEHGILFHVTLEENGKKVDIVNYWVIGSHCTTFNLFICFSRLFYNPYPRELYVCYKDNIPQDLVEIAFRLGMNIAG